jgi:DNA-binding transcriptional ArsR family regulator
MALVPSSQTLTRRTKADRLDSVFSALGDATRRSLLKQLSRGEATISELAEPFDMTLAAVSKHVSILEHAGLIRTEKSGRSRRCFLNVTALDPADAWIDECRTFWSGTLDSLATHFERADARKVRSKK